MDSSFKRSTSIKGVGKKKARSLYARGSGMRIDSVIFRSTVTVRARSLLQVFICCRCLTHAASCRAFVEEKTYVVVEVISAEARFGVFIERPIREDCPRFFHAHRTHHDFYSLAPIIAHYP